MFLRANLISFLTKNNDVWHVLLDLKIVGIFGSVAEIENI